MFLRRHLYSLVQMVLLFSHNAQRHRQIDITVLVWSDGDAIDSVVVSMLD